MRSKDCTIGLTPRYTVTMCLDGTNLQAQERYRRGIDDVAEWFEMGGKKVDVSDRFGPGRYVFTTRAGGAMDLEIKYKERSLTFLIQGRNLYLRGWKGRGKVFELDDANQPQNFTLDKRCVRLKYGLNYRDLVGSPGMIPTGLWQIRHAFDKIWEHAGGSNTDISTAIAIFAVHISEATRFPPLLNYMCDSFINLNLSTLGKKSSNLIYPPNYKKISGRIMENVVRMKQGLEPLPVNICGLTVTTMDEAIGLVRVLFRDGYDKGEFKHEDKPKLPIFENTLNDIVGDQEVQGKRKYHHPKVNPNKKPKGGGGSEEGGGLMGGGRDPKGGGGGLTGGGRDPKGGGGLTGGGRDPKGGGGPEGRAGGFPASVSPTGGRGRPPTSLHPTGGFRRPPTSFHPTGGLKGLLEDNMPSSLIMGIAIKSGHVCHNEHPCSPLKHISYQDPSMNLLSLRKMLIFPTAPLPNKRCFPTPFPFLAPRPSLVRQTPDPSLARQTPEKIRSLPLHRHVLSDVIPRHHCRSAMEKLLKPQYLSRALRWML